MLLSDKTIKDLIKKRELIIEPFNESLVGPSSVDLRLGTEFLVFDETKVSAIDVRQDVSHYMKKIIVPMGESITIQPGMFLLATTLEYIKLPDYISARIEGKSSLARLGLIIHSTGGFIDAGFEGQLTLELSNVNRVPIKLYVGMPICQIAFILQDKPSEQPYWKRKTSKYKKQKGPIPSRIHLEFMRESRN